MHMLVDEVKPAVHRYAAPYPVFAYLPNRSTKHALQRVYQHCSFIRSECALATNNVHHRFQAQALPDLIGGLQVCLYLSSAFDRVPWDYVADALHDAEVPSDHRAILMTWLQASTYTIHHGKRACEFPVSRGVKQGCRASPTLFLAYMILFCKKVDQKLGAEWCQKHLTQYADDTHLLVSSNKEFQDQCQSKGWLLPDGKWVFQTWCKDTRALVVDKSKQPVLQQTLVTSLRHVCNRVMEGRALRRFCATRKLETCQSGVVLFLQDISIRDADGQAIWTALMEIQGCSALQLIGVNYKRESLS